MRYEPSRTAKQVPPPPQPAPIYRLVHVDNLATLLERGALHSPTGTPNDGLPYRTIHDADVQTSRRLKPVPCGPGGTVHDYVPFYFGPLSPMLLKLKSGYVEGYSEGQNPLVYLATSCQTVVASGARFVFTDGHGLATFTKWFDDLDRLDAVDWPLVVARYWSDNPDDNDRKRRKQAEFLVWQLFDWSGVIGIRVFNAPMKERVEGILRVFPQRKQVPVSVRPDLYYY